MKRWRMMFSLLMFALLVGCGDDDKTTFVPVPVPAPTPTPTPAGTVVSLTTVKSFLMGTGTPDSQISANLTGATSTGTSVTGSITLTVLGPLVVSGQSVTGAQTTLNVTNAGTTTQSVNTLYFLPNGDLFQQTTSITGLPTVTGTPIVQGQLPDSAQVGQSGNLWTISESSGATVFTTWRLDPEFNGNSKLAITSVAIAGGTVVDVTTDTIFLNSSGNPYAFTVSDTAGGSTTTLSGNRI